MEIRILQGTLGMDSPSNDGFGLVVVTRGTMSRTGRCMGNVDEGYCVQVVAKMPRVRGTRRVLSTERLFTRDRWNAETLNRGGSKGAFEECPPTTEAVEAAVARAQALLLAGGPALDGIQLRTVEGGEPGSQHVYRLAGTKEELGRDEAVRRAAEALRGREAGTDLGVDRKPSHGQRWDPWRRYTVHLDGGIVRADR